MRNFLGLVGVALTATLAAAAPAAANGDLRCNGVFTGKVYDDVVVPPNGACTLIDSTVAGHVRVQKNAYFQSTRTTVGGSVSAREAQTVFVDAGSRVAGDVKAYRTAQVFVFNSTVTRSISVQRTSQVVQICGTTVRRGDILVDRSGRDILVGDPLTVGCRGNSVRRGDVRVRRNFTDVEFVIRGNTIRRGDLEVFKNTGPVPKIVQDNTGGARLRCKQNGPRVVLTHNTGWDRKQGRCA